MTMASNTTMLEQPLALAIFTRQFSAMIDAGFSLVRTIAVLADSAPAPYDHAARRMFDAFEEYVRNEPPPSYDHSGRVVRPAAYDGPTLSGLMSERSGLFSAFYVKMVRVGEIGGVLEVTLRFLADLLDEAWGVARRSDHAARVAWVLYPSHDVKLRDWADLNSVQRCFVLALFCKSLGTTLGAGVPRNFAFEVASDLLPDAQRDAVRALVHADADDADAVVAARDRRLGEATEAFAFLPALVMEMLAVGEADGTLNLMMEKAAYVYEHELHCRLL